MTSLPCYDVTTSWWRHFYDVTTLIWRHYHKMTSLPCNDVTRMTSQPWNDVFSLQLSQFDDITTLLWTLYLQMATNWWRHYLKMTSVPCDDVTTLRWRHFDPSKINIYDPILKKFGKLVTLLIPIGGNRLAPPTEGERVAWGRLPSMILRDGHRRNPGWAGGGGNMKE